MVRENNMVNILEGLHMQRENKVNESPIQDVPVTKDKWKLADSVSKVLTKKYEKHFRDYGGYFIDFSVSTDDDRELGVDDAIYSCDMGIVFDDELDPNTVKSVQALIKRVMRNYPKMDYNKRDSSFFFEVQGYENVIDVMDTIRKDGVNFGRLYTILDERDIERGIQNMNKEYYDDLDDRRREYNRQRL